MDRQPEAGMTGDVATLEAAIEGLVGVLAARIRMGPGDAIDEIEILAEGSKAPIQVVGDVKSLLFARFGINVDPDRITVAKIEAGDEMGLRTVRLRISRIDVRHAEGEMQVEVVLSEGGRQHVGRAAAARLRATSYWLGAAAALNAVEAALGRRGGLRLQDATQVELAGERAVVVAIRQVRDDAEVTLLGVSLVLHSELEAGVRAALDAVNRRFGS